MGWRHRPVPQHVRVDVRQRLGQPRLDLPRQRRLQPVHAQRMERIRRRIRGGRRRHRIRAGVYNTLNGNLAYGNLVDDVSVAAEGGDGDNLVTNGGFESPSLTKDGETGSVNAPANAATQRPAPRITPPIGRIASPSQSANKRRLASFTGLVIALPYFVPRKSVPGNKMRKGNDRRYPLLLTTYDFAYLWRDVRQKRRKNRRFIPPTMLCGTLFRSRLCQTGLNRKS